MKTLVNFLVTSVLSLRVAAEMSVGAGNKQEVFAVKKTEIKAENAKDGIQKMIQTGFIKPRRNGREGRILRSKNHQPHPQPHHLRTTRKKNKPHMETTRHERDSEWYDDYFVSL